MPTYRDVYYDPAIRSEVARAVIDIALDGPSESSVAGLEAATRLGGRGAVIVRKGESTLSIDDTIGYEASYYAYGARTGDYFVVGSLFGTHGGVVASARSLIPKPTVRFRNLLTGKEAAPGSDWENLSPEMQEVIAWGLVAGKISRGCSEDVIFTACIDGHPSNSRQGTGTGITFKQAWSQFPVDNRDDPDRKKARLYLETGDTTLLPFAASPAADASPAGPCGGEWNIAVVRQLLLAAFTAEDLRRFCVDRPTFQAVVKRFGTKHGLEDMVDELIGYVLTMSLMTVLLAEVNEQNPRQYVRYEPYLRPQ